MPDDVPAEGGLEERPLRAARHRQPQVVVGAAGDSGGPRGVRIRKSLLNQIRLVDELQRVAIFGQRRRERIDPDWASVEPFDDCRQDPAIAGVEAGRVDLQAAEELTTIVRRSARLLEIPIDDAGAEEIGRRAGGTPRIANRLLRRIRDFADVRGDGRITRDVAEYALGRLEVDAAGLDAGDRRILSTIVKRFDGGPVGIDSLAASLAEDRDTLEFVYEPYLIQEGFLIRTPRGRQITRRAYDHLGVAPPSRPQGTLF